MSTLVRRFVPITLLLLAFGARAESVANWADTTTEIATDGPNTIRTMALAQSAVYEAVNAITAIYPGDRVDLGPTRGASIDAAIAAAPSVHTTGVDALRDRGGRIANRKGYCPNIGRHDSLALKSTSWLNRVRSPSLPAATAIDGAGAGP